MVLRLVLARGIDGMIWASATEQPIDAVERGRRRRPPRRSRTCPPGERSRGPSRARGARASRRAHHQARLARLRRRGRRRRPPAVRRAVDALDERRDVALLGEEAVVDGQGRARVGARAGGHVPREGGLHREDRDAQLVAGLSRRVEGREEVRGRRTPLGAARCSRGLDRHLRHVEGRSRSNARASRRAQASVASKPKPTPTWWISPSLDRQPRPMSLRSRIPGEPSVPRRARRARRVARRWSAANTVARSPASRTRSTSVSARSPGSPGPGRHRGRRRRCSSARCRRR